MLGSNSKTSSPESFYPKLVLGPRLWRVPLIAGLALIVGLTVARGWIYAAAFCFLCLLLLWPIEVGLGAYVLFLPFEPISMVGNNTDGTSITWVLGILAGCAVLGTMVVRGRFRRPPKAVLWWTLLAFWATLASAWAINPDLALKRLPTVFSLLVLYIICACTRFEERELKAVALFSIAGGCAAAVYASFLAPAAYSGPAALRNSLAWGNTAADPNGFAETLLVPLALSLGGFLLLRNRHARALMLAAFGLIGYALLLTMSRGAIVALLVMALVYIRHMPRKLSRRLLIPAAFLVVAALMMATTLISRFSLAVETGGAGRLDIWTAGLQAIKEHGLIGAGLDNFPLAYSDVAGYASEFRGIARASHNIFLNIAVELGIPGFVLFIAAMRHQLGNAKRALRAQADRFSAPILICYSCCWSVLIAGLFLDIVWRKTFWLSWTFLTLALAKRQEGETV